MKMSVQRQVPAINAKTRNHPDSHAILDGQN